jgi:ubiquinone/menaquinone biosynthesis C-methylase UbiE
MAHRICPWWLGYVLVSPLRRWRESPRQLLTGLVRDGMTVIEPGCGMGFFTLDVARLVGPRGRVIALDVQPRMLAGLRRRAAKAGLGERIDARLVGPQRLGLDDLAGKADLAVALHVVHEVPDQRAFLTELLTVLRPGGRLFVVEPTGHVTGAEFADTLATAVAVGFRKIEAAAVGRNLEGLLENPATGNGSEAAGDVAAPGA